MTRERTPDERFDEAAAYLLGALPELEAQAFRRELMRDADLAAYVNEIEPTVDALLQSPETVEPPANLKQSLMAAAQADLDARHVIEEHHDKRSDRATESRWSPASALTALLRAPAFRAVAATVVVAAVAIGGYTVGDNRDQGGPSPSLSATVQLQAEAERSVGGTIAMIGDGSRGAVVRMHGYKPETKGKIYQLWVQRAGGIEPSTVFGVARNGTADVVIASDMRDVTAVMVTEEKRGGSNVPTLPVLAKATLN